MSRDTATYHFGIFWLGLLLCLAQGTRAKGSSLPDASTPPAVKIGATGLNPVALQQLTLTHRGDSCWLCMPIALWGKDVPRGHRLTVTPRLVCPTDTAAFAAVVAYGQWAWYAEARSGHDDTATDMHLRAIDIKDGRQHAYARALAWQPWMDYCALTVQYTETDGCDDIVAQWEQTLVPPPAVTAIGHAVRPLRDRLHHRQGEAYVDFHLDQTTIDPDYHDNRREIARIVSVIDSLRRDSTVIMQRIQLRGFASPEGAYAHNERLARDRAAALRRYVVEQCGVDEQMVSSDYEPEDWQGLRRRVATAPLADRHALLALIDQPGDPDRRLSLIARRHPAAYRYMRDSIFPYLRHTDYRIDYVGRYTEPAPAGTAATDSAVVVERASLFSAADAPMRETHSNFRTYRPLVALKTNVLFDALLTPNIEVELPLRGRWSRWSIMVEDWFPWFRTGHNSAGDGSPYHRSDQRPTRRSYEVWALGAELRYWLWPRCGATRPALCGGFIGLYGAGGKYDVERHSRGDQGEFTSLGIAAGYAWPVGRHWNVELSAAIGYVGGPQRHYEAEFDDARLIFRHYDRLRYVGPTKLKVSAVWLLPTPRRKGGAR